MMKFNFFCAVLFLTFLLQSCNFASLNDQDAISSKSSSSLPLSSHPQNSIVEQEGGIEYRETNTINFLTAMYSIGNRLDISMETVNRTTMLPATQNSAGSSMPDGESASSLTSSSVLAVQQVLLAGCIATVEENRGLRAQNKSLSTFNVNQANPSLAMSEQNWQNYEKDLIQRFHGILSPTAVEIQPLRDLRITMTSRNIHASAIAEAMCFASAMGSDIWLR